MLTAGQLDPTFGTGGKVLTDFSSIVMGPANALVLQPDGKIVVAGGAFVLARYNPDGSLDAGFGAAGIAASAFRSVLSTSSTANGLALQADGKIVVVGATTMPGLMPPPAFVVARYNPDGSPDATFGTGGIVTTNITQADEAFGVAVQADGKIVVGGGQGFALARYNPDGSLDTSFGTGGKVTTGFGAAASGVVLQADGKILVVGNTGSGFPLQHGVTETLAMARYNTDGSLDATFGTAGELVFPAMSLTTLGSPQLQAGIALQADGRIVVAGANFVVLRLLANGNLDPSFGTGGSVAIDFGAFSQTTSARSVALQADGKIVVAGSVRSAGNAVGFALVRLSADGTLDPNFGSAGKITTDFGDHTDAAIAVVLQPDGEIVAAGSARIVGFSGNTALASSIAVARYLPDNVGTSNQRFVEQVYWDLLRRPVDVSGLASWTGLLDQGLSRTQVAAAIQNSPEYHTLVVRDLYQLVLGRTVDQSGLTTWVSFLNRGGTAEQLEAVLLGSAEFFVAHGGNNDQGFLPALYQIVLQRPIDPTGAQAWGQILQSGALSRQAVAAAVLAGLESDRLEVQSLYMQFLHRAADPSGLDTFAMALQRGLSNDQVGVILMSSAEYFARV